MEHGALSSPHLKEACYLVGKAFGVRNLGHFLYEITYLESKSGQRKSKFGGVCSISHYQFGLMQQHHRFYHHRKVILNSLGIDLKSINFAHLSNNPTLSLIIVAAWLLANIERVPKRRLDRAKLFSKWWRAMPCSEYMEKTYDLQ